MRKQVFTELQGGQIALGREVCNEVEDLKVLLLKIKQVFIATPGEHMLKTQWARAALA